MLKSPYLRWLLVGLLIRFLVMPFTIHPDLRALSFGAYLLSFTGNFHLYDYLSSLAATNNVGIVYGGGAFTYPPAVFFFQGAFMFLLKPFYGPMFGFWLQNNFLNSLLDPSIFKYLFLLKLPYLLFDLSLAFLLTFLFVSHKDKALAFKLWMLNPVAIYASFAIGQFDIIATFFTIAALILAQRKKIILAALMLGFGAAFKIYPLFLLPILAVFYAKDIKKVVGIFIAGLAPLALSIMPFLNSLNFKNTVLGSEQSQRIMAAGFNFGQDKGLYLFFLLLGVLCLNIYLNKKGIEDLWKYFLATLALFFALSFFHPQWFVWLTPFLIIYYIKSRNKFYPILLFVLYLCLLVFFENSLTLGLFSPINSLFSSLPSIASLINPIYNADRLRNIIFSFFAATTFYFLYTLIFSWKDEGFHEKN